MAQTNKLANNYPYDEKDIVAIARSSKNGYKISLGPPHTQIPIPSHTKTSGMPHKTLYTPIRDHKIDRDFFLRELLTYVKEHKGSIAERRFAIIVNMGGNHWGTLVMSCSDIANTHQQTLKKHIEKNPDDSLEKLNKNQAFANALKGLYGNVTVEYVDSSDTKPDKNGYLNKVKNNWNKALQATYGGRVEIKYSKKDRLTQNPQEASTSPQTCGLFAIENALSYLESEHGTFAKTKDNEAVEKYVARIKKLHFPNATIIAAESNESSTEPAFRRKTVRDILKQFNATFPEPEGKSSAKKSFLASITNSDDSINEIEINNDYSQATIKECSASKSDKAIEAALKAILIKGKENNLQLIGTEKQLTAIEAVIDKLKEEGQKINSTRLVVFPPSPAEEMEKKQAQEQQQQATSSRRARR